MITVQNLNFEYPGRRVLHDVSFTIETGSITALTGPNGAGKTTLLRCIAGLERWHSGTITLDGIDVAADPRAAHARCGYLSDFFGVYDDLTARQCLTFAAWSHGVKRADIAPRIDSLAALTGLGGYLDARAGTFSRGYRQRLGIALAMIHDPAVIILDEPASGMDPEARAALSHFMRVLKAEGRTLIVSSHILNELEDYCTSMLVIRDGRVGGQAALGDAGGRHVKIVFATGAQTHAALAAAQPGVTGVRREGETLLCGFNGDAAAQRQLLQALMVAGAEVLSFELEQKSLQDAYMETARA
jgi:ABC-2 type transport system ATP-binding protein